MRAPAERTMRDLYDRTGHKDLAAPEERVEGRGGGRPAGSSQREVVSMMEDKTKVRKRLVSSDNSRVKAESGTCNVCYAPCSSCLHRSLALEDSNVGCGSSQTCSTMSQIKNSSLTRSEKGLRNRGGEIADNFSAASSDASYSETGGNKVIARPSSAEDSSEVDMPAKRRKLLNQDRRVSKTEYHDDSNSCVTGISAEGKLLLDKKKLSASASSQNLSGKNCTDNSIANHRRLRNPCVSESTERQGSDVDDVRPISCDRLVPLDSPCIMTKKMLRTQSSISALKGLSPKRQSLPCEPYGKTSLTNNDTEQALGEKSNPCVVGGVNHGVLTGCSTSNRNENEVGLSPKDLEIRTACLKVEIQEHADIQCNDDAKRNGGDKQDWDQDCSMDIFGDGKLDIQNEIMTECGNSEGLIDVNVCDICGDVGKEYLLATCTRCLEGAEHTYCMRMKLDKVPEGEWLCEECQLQEDESKKARKNVVAMANISEGKNQTSESRSNPKALHVVVPNLDAPQITCATPTADQYDAKNQKLHLASTDPQARQAKVTTPAVERLDLKNENLLSTANRKKLQGVTSDLEARPHTHESPTSGSLNKNRSSEVLLKHKKLRVSTDMESPLSSEGLRSSPMSCKRQAENTLSPKPRLIKTGSFRKQDVFSRENSFKKSNKGSLNSLDNAPVSQAVRSSQNLSRSYSLGRMVNAKAPVPSPRGPLSKQLSFNSSNNGPKVKQLAEGVASKLRPMKHSSRDPRDKGPIKKFMKSGSFKSEGLVCKDASSSKQKQSVQWCQDEKPGISKPMKEKILLEKKPSFSFRKPNIPISPRLDNSIKPEERKIVQEISRNVPSILKSSKIPGHVEKKQSSDLSKSDKQDVAVHRKPIGVALGKDTYTVKISDLPVPSQCVQKDSSNDVQDEDSFVSVKNGNKEIATESPAVLPTTCAAMACESDLRDTVARACAPEDSASKVVCCQQKPLENTKNSSSKIVEAPQASKDILPESPRGSQMVHSTCPSDNRLDIPDLKQEAFVDRASSLENLSRDLAIPEQSYIWQGSFEVSRHRNSHEMFHGIQAYLSTCASSKVLGLVKQLPHKIQLTEVPRHYSWPLQFKEVNPTKDNVALFFFAKDVESYEGAYGKLLESMLLGDLSLTAIIGGTELLIFPSDKLPEGDRRWNGLLYFWGIFCARKASRSTEPRVTQINNCPLEPTTGPVIEHDMCPPKVLQSLGIDLNECPNDDLCDPAISFGPEMEKSGAFIDHNTLLESKYEDRKLNTCEIHHEETAVTRQNVLGHPTAAPSASHFPTTSTGEGHDMMQDYPIAAKGTTGTTGKTDMEEKGFSQDGALFSVAQQAGAIRSISDEMIAKKQALWPPIEVSSQHFSGSKTSDDLSKLTSNSDMCMLDSGSSKRQKTSHGKPSMHSFGDEQMPSKCLSKIQRLQAVQHNPFDDVQYIYRGPSDPGSLKKSIPDHVIHVLSSDDEDSPEPSTSLNKASLKADEGSSPLLSLSLSSLAGKHNLSGSDIGEDATLPLSLGLPDIVDGNRVLEMKQFLPEKPGINT